VRIRSWSQKTFRGQGQVGQGQSKVLGKGHVLCQGQCQDLGEGQFMVMLDTLWSGSGWLGMVGVKIRSRVTNIFRIRIKVQYEGQGQGQGQVEGQGHGQDSGQGQGQGQFRGHSQGSGSG
jgi:hypothetical protein